MICFSVCALAIIGTPLTVGFVSKWLLGSATLQAGRPVFLAVLLLSALLSAAYYLPIIHTAFFKPPGDSSPSRAPGFRFEANPAMLWPIVILTVLVILAGVWVTLPGFPHSLVSMVAGRLFA